MSRAGRYRPFSRAERARDARIGGVPGCREGLDRHLQTWKHGGGPYEVRLRSLTRDRDYDGD